VLTNSAFVYEKTYSGADLNKNMCCPLLFSVAFLVSQRGKIGSDF